MGKHLLDIKSLTQEEVSSILAKAKKIQKTGVSRYYKKENLAGALLATLFYEASTRTRLSFEIAAKYLKAEIVNFDLDNSSIHKGETDFDVLKTLEQMGVQYVIIRNKETDRLQKALEHTQLNMVNAGDGIRAHPTQALVDLFTLQQEFKELKRRKVLFVGDVKHSRVARSTSLLMQRSDMEVAFLAPEDCRLNLSRVKQFSEMEEALAWQPEVVYMLRIQWERHSGEVDLSKNSQQTKELARNLDYNLSYGITSQRLNVLESRGVKIMHPGPVNRGVELCDEAIKSSNALIGKQVSNGIPVRMAVLLHLFSK